jgi:hypothetical protein
LEKKDAMKKFMDSLQALLNHFQLLKVLHHHFTMDLTQNHTKLYLRKKMIRRNATLERKDAMKKYMDLLPVLLSHFQLSKVQLLHFTMDLTQNLTKL